MKKMFLLSFLIILTIVLSLASVFRSDYLKIFFNFGSTETTSTTSIPTTTSTTLVQENNTNETFGNAGGAGASSSLPATVINASKVITLEIIDLCQGKMEEVHAISEGMQMCLNQKYPYYIGFYVSGSNLATWVYNTSGFNQTYDLSNTTTVYYIFVEDVASVTREIEKFYIVPNNTCFSLGDYTLYTIWYNNPNTGSMDIVKMIAAIPLNIDRNIISKTNWEEIKIYLKTYEMDFFLGNLFFEIK